jgi:integral membrane protein
MTKFLTTSIGRLRLFAFLESISLLVLVFVALPLKHLYKYPVLVKVMGPIHGSLFLLFVFNALNVGVEQKWKFKEITWKLLVACFIPFGLIYFDFKILRNLSSLPEES